MDQARFADTVRATRHMFIRDLELSASIGVYKHEHEAAQRIRINIDLAVTDDGAAANISRPAIGHDDLARVVDYETIVNQVRALVGAGHVQLVETLAERLAEACLADPRIRVARVRVEKLDVFADAASAGVEVERRR
jgi:dihydroneopterin aldolase